MDVKKFIEITVRHEVLDRYSTDEQCQSALDEILNSLPESEHEYKQRYAGSFFKETDKEITKRTIEKYVGKILKDADDGCPVAREFRAVFQGCIDWLEADEQIKE